MRRLLSVLLYAMAIFASFAATQASAANKNVACHGEDLQKAIENATEGDILYLEPHCDYVIEKSAQNYLWDRKTFDKRALKTITTKLTIEGNGATIKPMGRNRVSQTICDALSYSGGCLKSIEVGQAVGDDMGIFLVLEGNLTLKNLTLSNGRSLRGGAIYQNGGNVSLESVTITDSEAYGETYYDALSRTNAIGGLGGAILQTGGNLSLSDSKKLN
ncbi:hypothetical protein [Caballeronia humi]|uniref:Uncharacterized protein n=1 Tax=Caballeronia humi TaxID=326474 RepID=A0A158GQX8_9BURK|nr:hypothetical protein [Caballeronia humi]SAL34554.1 hypothetical protein AWB65_02388 [Caballeronia humi]